VKQWRADILFLGVTLFAYLSLSFPLLRTFFRAVDSLIVLDPLSKTRSSENTKSPLNPVLLTCDVLAGFLWGSLNM